MIRRRLLVLLSAAVLHGCPLDTTVEVGSDNPDVGQGEPRDDAVVARADAAPDVAPPSPDGPLTDAVPPIPDALVPSLDLTVDPKADGAPPVRDAFVPTPDAFVPTPDAFVPTPDAFVPTPDALVPTPDAFVPTPDALVPTPDAFVPTPDAFVSMLDAFVPPPDASVSVVDAFVPVVDAFVAVIDAFVPVVDAFVPDLDAAVPVVDAAVPAACAPGEYKTCVTSCVPVGLQNCVGDQWGACLGTVDCSAPRCADTNRDQCPLPECSFNQTRQCLDGCFQGTQSCVANHWAVCPHAAVACGDPVCAAAEPPACPAACADGGVRPCVDGCFHGRQICAAGAWGVCQDLQVRCDDAACAAQFSATCNPTVCVPGTVRGCTDACWAGAESCVDGHWTACSDVIYRCNVPVCVTANPAACP